MVGHVQLYLLISDYRTLCFLDFRFQSLQKPFIVFGMRFLLFFLKWSKTDNLSVISMVEAVIIPLDLKKYKNYLYCTYVKYPGCIVAIF